MILLLLLSFLLGNLLEECQGLQTNILYQYDYTGTLSTWIPNDPTQSSGSALRAVVTLQLSQNGDILVKATDIQVAERNGKAACDAYQHADFPYREMDSEDAALLEEPFLVNVNISEATRTVSYMEVPEEPVWVTNIRRGIINTIPLVVMEDNHPTRLTFGFKEDTMIGNCFNWYSMLKLASHRAKVENKKQEDFIEIDVQRERAGSYTAHKAKGKTTKAKGPRKSQSPTKTSPDRYTVSPISDTLSIVTRTLDDEQCKDKHFTMKINGNQESVERTQRSSEGIFLIRGEGEVLRLERGEVMGNIVIYTGESADEFIRISTKQVLQLRAVRHVNEIPAITYLPKRRTLSFTTAEGPRSTVKEKLLGIPPATEQVQANMAGIKEDLLILKAMKAMREGESPDFLVIFQRLVERMSILSWTEMEDLVTQVANSERERFIIYQAFLASGSDEALRHILEEMKNKAFRSSHIWLVFQILEAPTTPIRNPALIPAMMEVVSEMGEDESKVKALSLLNIAKLVNRYCLNTHRENNCDAGCDTDFLLNTFLPMLSDGFQDPEFWKRLLNVQAVCALGSPHSIPYLQPIIQGTNNEDIDLRISAIYCLTADLLPKTAEEMVYDSLRPLMNNPTEYPEVRNIAFLVLTTWEPNLSWWEHVAISTWREKSNSVVDFISSTLNSLSEGSDPRSKNVKKVVNLAKHPQNFEANLEGSTYLYLDEVVKNCQVGTSFKLAWMSSTKSIFPRSVYGQLQFVSVMGMTHREKGVFFSSVLQHYLWNLQSKIVQQKNYEDWETFYEIFMELIENLELTPTNTHEPFMLLLISEPLPFIFGESSVRQRDNIVSWLMSVRENLPLHFRLADMTLVFPSDLGLPIVVKHEEDFVFAFTSNYTEDYTVEIAGNLNHRNALKTNALSAWSNGMAAGAGVEAYLDANVVLQISLENFLTSAADLTLSTVPKVKIVSLSNIMYTSLMPLYHIVDSVVLPGEPASTNLGWMVVWNGEPQEDTRILLSEFGIPLHSKWIGDFEQPKDFTFFKTISFTQVKYRNFNYKLVLDFPRKSVKFIFNFDIIEKDQGFPQQVSQQSQDLDDYELFSQVSQSTSNGYQDYGQGHVEAVYDGPESHSQTFSSHLAKMQELMMPPVGGKVYSVTAAMEPQDSQHKYEIAVTVASTTGNVGEKIMTKIHVVFMSSPMPGVITDTHLTCFDLRMETPFLLPLLPKNILLETDLASNLLITLYDGGNCEGQPIMKLQGNFDVSSRVIQGVRSVEEGDTCGSDFPMENNLFYDLANIKATWTQDFRNWSKVIQAVAESQMDFISSHSCKTDAGPDNELTAQAVLNTEMDELNITLSGPRQTSVILVPGAPLLSPFSGPGISGDMGKVCHITHQSVKTYDGLSNTFEPSLCWTTATIFSNSKTHTILDKAYSYLQVAIQVRYTEQWTVRIISPSSAVVIDVTRSEIMVNEEPLLGYNEKFVVHRLQDSMIVRIGMVVVRVGDAVDIMLGELYYGAVKGICGNYDGEAVNDMTGPTDCTYIDHALHTLAWNTPAVGCSRFSLRNKKRELAEYREDCDRDFFQPTDISQENAMKNCTEWKYDVRHDATGLFCKTKVPFPACRPGCNPGNSLTKRLQYSCQESSSTGQEQVQNAENVQCFTTVAPVSYLSGCYHL